MAEIWMADWTFYCNGSEIVSKDVVTKRIPVEFLLLDKLTYNRALRPFSTTQIKEFTTDKKTKFKKFKIVYTKKLGCADNDDQGLENLH